MSRVRAFNERLADRITTGLSSMWCAYVFTILSLLALPAAIASHDLLVIVGWTSQNFIQLVALSVLGAGQDKAAKWTAATLSETHDAVIQEVAGVAELVTDLHAKHTAVQRQVAAIHEQLTG
ncbi:MAG: hypothetical protein HOY79_50475 [Streptomyces sp.]|nr:hypothetical protein [Streptomyces sp.]